MKCIGRNKFGKAGFGEFVPQMISKHLLGAKDTAENKSKIAAHLELTFQ